VAIATATVAAIALLASLAGAETDQQGNLRVSVGASLVPNALPRVGQAPVAVRISGRIATTDSSSPPQLQRMTIAINKNGRLDYEGLPSCSYDQIQPASSQRALAACRDSLVGQGNFEADIILSGQIPYPSSGKFLLFAGKSDGHPVLLGHIYSSNPFATSFVVPFVVRHVHRSSYDTELIADLPKALGDWGYVTALRMNLSRRYRYRGKDRSFLSAGCPAPKGFSHVVFPLAKASFDFSGGKRLSSILVRGCRVHR
jgi:hypothetical protein